jgi:hypothetical protein
VTDGPLGEHIWDVSIASIGASFEKVFESSFYGQKPNSNVQSNLAEQCLYCLAALFVKTSLLAPYLRIFNPHFHAVVMIWVGIAAIVLA